MAAGIAESFKARADKEGEGFLELMLHNVTRGDQAAQDSRTYLDTFCHRASCAKGLLNTGEVLASVRDPRQWRAAALT